MASSNSIPAILWTSLAASNALDTPVNDTKKHQSFFSEQHGGRHHDTSGLACLGTRNRSYAAAIGDELLKLIRVSSPPFAQDLSSSDKGSSLGPTMIRTDQNMHELDMEIILRSVRSSREESERRARELECQRETINSLRRRLKQGSEKSEAIRAELRPPGAQKPEFQSSEPIWKQRSQELQHMVDEIKKENKELRGQMKSVVIDSNETRQRERETRKANNDLEKFLMLAKHDAEKAHLMAKLANSQMVMMNKRLQEADSCSRPLRKRIYELQKVQTEIRTVLRQIQETVARRQTGAPALEQTGLPDSSPRTVLQAEQHPSHGGEVNPAERNHEVPVGEHQGEYGRRSQDSTLGARRGLLSKLTDCIFRQRRTGLNKNKKTKVDAQDRPADALGKGRKFRRLRNLLCRESSATQSRLDDDSHITNMSAIMNTVGQLEEDVDALREVIFIKQSEVDRLQEELRATAEQSGLFERDLRAERQKLEMMLHEFSTASANSPKQSSLDDSAPCSLGDFVQNPNGVWSIGKH